jgi:hypothetical protein
VNRNHRRKQRTARGWLTGVGAVLVALAVIGLLLATKQIAHIGVVDARTGLLNGAGRRALRHHELLLQCLALGFGLLLVVVGAIWLRALIPPLARQSDQRLESGEGPVTGTNIVKGAALANALSADVERNQWVQHARAEIRTDEHLVLMRVDVDDAAPIAEVVSTVNRAVDRLKDVAELGRSAVVETTLRLAAPEPRRVS